MTEGRDYLIFIKVQLFLSNTIQIIHLMQELQLPCINIPSSQIILCSHMYFDTQINFNEAQYNVTAPASDVDNNECRRSERGRVPRVLNPIDEYKT
jgi:hypothetical protein